MLRKVTLVLFSKNVGQNAQESNVSFIFKKRWTECSGK